MSNDPNDKLTAYAELAEIWDHLPLLVREKRRRLGLSLRAAGEQAGLPFSTIRRVEQGDDTQMSALRKALTWIGEPDNAN